MNKFLKGAVLLLITAVLFLSTVVTAETVKNINETEKDSSFLKSTKLKTINPTIEPILGPVMFSQLPPEEDDPWSFYTSATNLGYLCMDDFWSLTEDICDFHWWGLSLIFDYGWYACDPTGMMFEIIFYDVDMNPVCTYTDLAPTAQPTGKFFSGFEMYYWELDLDPSCSLTDGWVSIQSIYSPTDCSFLWANSLTGNLNAMQNGGSLSDNLAFELTYKKSRDFNRPFLNFLESHPNLFPILQRMLQNLGL